MNRHFSPKKSPRIKSPQRLRQLPWSGLILICVVQLLIIVGCSEAPSSAPPDPFEQGSVQTEKPAEVSISSVFSRLGSANEESRASQDVKIPIAPLHLAFADVTSTVGLEFQYDNGANGRQLMVEATGGGCGWIDVDHDGYIDIFFPQGGDPARAGSPDQPLDRLFRSRDGNSFSDVSQAAGLKDTRYGQGVAIGDFDNDGFDDLFVTNVGVNQLYHNQGDGSFFAVPTAAGFSESLWSSSAAWGDIDRDGDLDLYVCNYCDYDPEHPMPCVDSQGIASICHPKDVEPVPDECYRNLGNGQFEPCAQALGLYGSGNRALGVVIADFNNDRWPDIYVANDTTANFLFLNDDGHSFHEVASLMGCAVNVQGMPQASMGIGCGDFDGNGLLDLYLTHFTNEWNTLYTNRGEQGFYDTTAIGGLVVPTMNRLAFGTIMNDLNQDGTMEIFVANGHINPQEAGGSGYPMKPQLFSYNGNTWDDVGDSSGEYFHRSVVGRGIATADYDNDGRLDLCVVHHDCPAALLRNECNEGTWLQVQLVGTHSNRNAVGTRVYATAGGTTLMQELMGGTSYCSAMQYQLNFGFSEPTTSCSLRMEWTDGETSLLDNVPLNQAIVLLEPHQDTQPTIWTLPHRGKR